MAETLLTHLRRINRVVAGLVGLGLLGVASKPEQQALGRGRGVAVALGAVACAGCGRRLRFGLGDGGALAAAVEAPAVIRALQFTLLVDAALAEGHEPVGADIGEGAPLLGRLVPPEHQVAAQQGEAPGCRRVQILQDGHCIPAPLPVLLPALLIEGVHGCRAAGGLGGHRGDSAAGMMANTPARRGHDAPFKGGSPAAVVAVPNQTVDGGLGSTA